MNINLQFISQPGEKLEEIRIRYIEWKKDHKTWMKGQEKREKNKSEILNYYLDVLKFVIRL